MRCFLALPLPEALIAPLLAVQGAVPVGRAVPEENLHVTLAFLGEVAEADLRELDLELGGAALPGCFLQVAGLESFGGRAPKLLAAALRPDPGLLALHGRVARACRAAGIELERRRAPRRCGSPDRRNNCSSEPPSQSPKLTGQSSQAHFPRPDLSSPLPAAPEGGGSG